MSSTSTFPVANSRNTSSTSEPKNYSFRTEKLILLVMAIVGMLGSIYLYNCQQNQNNFQSVTPLAMVANQESKSTLDKNNIFDSYIKIEGRRKVGNQLQFTFVANKQDHRFVMEMGDGRRMIITGNSFPYTYFKKGKYTLELKSIYKGLISTVATKEIKIK